jgi:hypothetical protein
MSSRLRAFSAIVSSLSLGGCEHIKQLLLYRSVTNRCGDTRKAGTAIEQNRWLPSRTMMSRERKWSDSRSISTTEQKGTPTLVKAPAKKPAARKQKAA